MINVLNKEQIIPVIAQSYKCVDDGALYEGRSEGKDELVKWRKIAKG